MDLKPAGSWGDIADVLFLDQPAGTGFSYFDKTATPTLAAGATEVVQLLTQFLKMYPEYNKRSLIIAGESYAGKYVPQIAKFVQDYKTEQMALPQAQQAYFELTAILLGDPFTAPIP